jgi:pimeloyl-ACP methyl ester carboxylesterase
VTEFQHDRITFNYDVVGEGCPFIFSHGLAWDLDRSRELLGRLPGHQLITWDMRAHGMTNPLGPAEALSFQTFANDLAAFMDHLGIASAVIGGISLGAAVALQFAADNPSRVCGLVLLQPAWLPDAHPVHLEPFVTIADLLDRFGTEEGLARFEQDTVFKRLRISAPDAAASFVGQFQKPLAAERSERLRRMPADRPLGNWGRVAQLRVPSLVLGTDGDPIHPIEYAEQWARCIPSAQLSRVIPKSTDSDRYVQSVRFEVLRFLDKTSRISPTTEGLETVK